MYCRNASAKTSEAVRRSSILLGRRPETRLHIDLRLDFRLDLVVDLVVDLDISVSMRSFDDLEGSNVGKMSLGLAMVVESVGPGKPQLADYTGLWR